MLIFQKRKIRLALTIVAGSPCFEFRSGKTISIKKRDPTGVSLYLTFPESGAPCCRQYSAYGRDPFLLRFVPREIAGVVLLSLLLLFLL